jgi:dimethylglycine dehydrogenase
LPKEGRTALNYFLAPSGGIVTEMTVTNLGHGKYWLISAASGERHDLHWLHSHLPADGSVTVSNETARYGTLILVGPRSREVLAKLTGADLSNAGFPWLSVRTIEIAYTKALAFRVNYVGELGWELHIPSEHVASVYDLLFEAGEEFGIADFGLYAMDSLRLEKCYRSWKADLTTDYTPYMASLDRFVRLDKVGGFIGQPALKALAEKGPPERFVPLIIDAADADASAVSIVYHGEEVVGLVTSGGFGYRINRSIALAYVRTDLAVEGQELTVEILGERKRAVVGVEPLYDPTNARLRA